MTTTEAKISFWQRFYRWYATCWSSFGLTAISLIVVSVALCYYFVNKWAREAGLPGQTTIQISAYVPKNLSGGNFVPGELGINEISLAEYQKLEPQMQFHFCVPQVYAEHHVVQITYYAKNESSTHIYKTLISREVPIAENQWKKFVPETAACREGKIIVEGKFSGTANSAFAYLFAFVASFILAIVLHILLYRSFKSSYPQLVKNGWGAE